MTERIIEANGITIWTESFGDPDDAPLLLVMGATAQGIYWPEEFCQALVDQGRFVIRYDNRDTGQSTCVDFATDPYTLDDLAADAIGVLDAYGIERADIAGASMGGMITQALMIQSPARVKSATLIMSSPLSGGGGDAPALGNDDLPGPDPEWMADAMANIAFVPETREEKIESRINAFRILVGSAEPFDEEQQRGVATREVDRASNLAAINNHGLAIAASSPPDRRPFLAGCNVPTVVIHGTEDPILPYPHGQALSDTIPGATLVTLDRAGHEMPQRDVQTILDAMREVAAREA